jgi:hypothetical protein
MTAEISWCVIAMDGRCKILVVGGRAAVLGLDDGPCRKHAEPEVVLGVWRHRSSMGAFG